MAPPRRRVRDPEATRRKLLKAGIDVFSRKGPDGASVAMIARKARVNRRMLYHYYESKEGLYQATIRHAYERLAGIEVDLAHMVLPAEELLEKMIRSYYDFLAGHPEVVRLLTWENLRLGKSAQEIELKSFKAPIIKALRIALTRGKKDGRFRKDVNEKQLLISCMALSFFYFSNQHTLGRGLGIDMTSKRAINKRIKHVVQLVLQGIGEG
jgi:AcrR family transcriptional regulator